MSDQEKAKLWEKICQEVKAMETGKLLKKEKSS